MKNFYKIFILLIFLITFSGYNVGDDLKYDRIARPAFEKRSKEIAERYKMRFLSSSVGEMLSDNEISWCSKFMIQHPMTIHEMRPIAQDIFKMLWQKVNDEPAFDKYLEACGVQSKKPKRPLETKLMGIKIVFWDQNVERPMYPYLAQVSFKEGKFHYYYADPKTLALKEPPIIEEITDFSATN